ncbi:hypothetical protein JOM56_003770 [Amanita muscaria]
MTIPNVFVIPPEEDHSPAWCYFDAAHSQLDHFNSTLILVDSDDHVECDMHGNPQPPLYREVADDSDVVEIVKVGRHALENEPTIQPEQCPTDFTRSKTLKSRASRMFHSLKKVGKRKRITDRVASSSMAPSHATQNSSEVPHAERGAVFSETLPRRKSVVLSQPFTVLTGPKSHSSSSHSQDRMASCPPHPEPTPNYYSDTMQGGVEETNTISPFRSPSPSPSFMAKRRFSKINLQKMFSFATPLENISHPVSNDLVRLSSEGAELVQSSSSSDRMPSLDTVNSSGNVASTASSHALYADSLPRQSLSKGIDAENTMLVEHPSLAAELSFNLGADLDLNLDVPDAAIHTPQVGIPPTSSSMHMNMDDGALLGDISFEMCLDSLHFDDLSFDVDRF